MEREIGRGLRGPRSERPVRDGPPAGARAPQTLESAQARRAAAAARAVRVRFSVCGGVILRYTVGYCTHTYVCSTWFNSSQILHKKLQHAAQTTLHTPATCNMQDDLRGRCIKSRHAQRRRSERNLCVLRCQNKPFFPTYPPQAGDLPRVLRWRTEPAAHSIRPRGILVAHRAFSRALAVVDCLVMRGGGVVERRRDVHPTVAVDISHLPRQKQECLLLCSRSKSASPSSIVCMPASSARCAARC